MMISLDVRLEYVQHTLANWPSAVLLRSYRSMRLTLTDSDL